MRRNNITRALARMVWEQASERFCQKHRWLQLNFFSPQIAQTSFFPTYGHLSTQCDNDNFRIHSFAFILMRRLSFMLSGPLRLINYLFVRLSVHLGAAIVAQTSTQPKWNKQRWFDYQYASYKRNSAFIV